MSNTRNAILRSACLVALGQFASGVAIAQDLPSATESADGVQVFDLGFFAAYNPVTAFDMVERVPGFAIDDGDDRRGFGATAGNVLVNGERPSSKTLISDQLKRIPADSVLGVELISGSSSSVDVRGQTQLVNVILKRTTDGGSPTAWLAELRPIQYSDKLGFRLQATKSVRLSETAEVSLDLQFPNLMGRTENIEVIRNADGDVTQIRDQFGQPLQLGVQGSANLSWKPTASDTVNANILYNPTWDSLHIGGFYEDAAGNFDGALVGRTEYDGKYHAEVGGDWEHRFDDALSVKFLGLATMAAEDQSDDFRFFNSAAALSGEQFLERTTETGERVGRGVLTWRTGDAHTLEFGAEGAFNFLDTTLDITFDRQDGAGPQPRPLPVADARVEELRGEVFITDIWSINSALTLESGLTFETSKITQTGDAENERELSFPKPRLVGTWQRSPSEQFRASIERDISQLDFYAFASSVDVREANQQLGNTDLEPEKAWKARIEWDKRFGGRGALNIAVFHDEIEDVDDTLPLAFCDGDTFAKPLRSCLSVPLSPADVFDAVGNIGDGTRTGIEVRGTMPLDWLGVPRAELRVAAAVADTSVEDPVTGEQRPFRFEEDWEYEVAFRQELPTFNLAWGVSTNQESSSYEYKLAEEVKNIRDGQHVDLFVETTAISGVTLRFGVTNIFSPTEGRLRTFYDPNRAIGVPSETFYRKQKGGPYGTRVFSIKASGTF